MSSRIEQIIEEIEEYVDSCKFQPLSFHFKFFFSHKHAFFLYKYAM